MRSNTPAPPPAAIDEWLEGQCHRVSAAGQSLAAAVGYVNERTAMAQSGELGRRQRITAAHIRAVEEACTTFHEVQTDIQEALFDCEHELRALRERDVSPAELLVDGERLIRQYRRLRRRARVIDGLLAYLPMVCAHATQCRDHLRHLNTGGNIDSALMVPDCGFVLVALEQLRDED